LGHALPADQHGTTCHYAKASRSQRAQYPIRRQAVKAKDRVGLRGSNLLLPNGFGIERLYTRFGSCHGPDAGGAPAGGVGGGVPTERIPPH
jgi:hypothetical protein